MLLVEGATLVRLHPYENLSYNALVGGLGGAFRRYDMDYWFNSMPEAIHLLEAYLRTKKPLDETQPLKIYSVAVCGERLTFDRTVTNPQLRWDFRPAWEDSEFFIATTQMNCDRDLDGEIVGTWKDWRSHRLCEGQAGHLAASHRKPCIDPTVRAPMAVAVLLVACACPEFGYAKPPAADRASLSAQTVTWSTVKAAMPRVSRNDRPGHFATPDYLILWQAAAERAGSVC